MEQPGMKQWRLILLKREDHHLGQRIWLLQSISLKAAIMLGGKTPEGKAISSRNAYKGNPRALIRWMNEVLRGQKRYLDETI